MNIGFLIEMLLSVVRGFLFNSKKAAPYAKWLLRIRDYLMLLFPIEIYPKNATGDPALEQIRVQPVPIDEVKKASSSNGFSLSNIFG
jgi:hypothetical protein